MRTSIIFGGMVLAIGLTVTPALAGVPGETPASGATTIQQTSHPSGMRDGMEKKYGPKWCQKHPRKCAKTGVPPA